MKKPPLISTKDRTPAYLTCVDHHSEVGKQIIKDLRIMARKNNQMVAQGGNGLFGCKVKVDLKSRGDWKHHGRGGECSLKNGKRVDIYLRPERVIE